MEKERDVYEVGVVSILISLTSINAFPKDDILVQNK